MVECRHGTDNTGHDGHRMSIAAEPAEEINHLFVKHGMICHQAFKLLELGRIGQVTVEQQEAHFQIMALRGELVDGIAAMQQYTVIAINEGNGRVASGGRGKAGVIGEDIGLPIEFSNINHIRSGCR